MVCQGINSLANAACGTQRCLRVVFGKELKYALKIRERVLRVDYLRHGLGRAAFRFLANRSSQG